MTVVKEHRFPLTKFHIPMWKEFNRNVMALQKKVKVSLRELGRYLRKSAASTWGKLLYRLQMSLAGLHTSWVAAGFLLN